MSEPGAASDPRATLDDEGSIAAFDERGMLAYVASMGTQLRRGWEVASSAAPLPSADGVRSLLVCGMGGSGVVGDVLGALFTSRLAVPIAVSKGYGVPAYCGKDTFVLVISFSGSTEETLSAYAHALETGARMVTFSAGGELADRSVADGVAHVALPEDVLVPRAALGYLTAAPMRVLDTVGLIPPVEDDLMRCSELLDRLAERLGPQRSTEMNEAKSLAAWLYGRTPVVWGSDGVAGAAALRWKTQLNENAKVPAFHSVLPELDHNEIEGWSPGTGEPFALIVLRHPGEHPRVALRAQATLDAIAPSGLQARHVEAEGSDPFENLFSLIVVGDLVSTYLAILRGVDPVAMPTLTGLKERLLGWQATD